MAAALNYAALWKKLASTAVTNDAAWLVPGAEPRVLVQTSAIDVANNNKRASIRTFGVRDGALQLLTPFPFEIKQVVLTAPSPSGRLLALIRDVTETKPAQVHTAGWGGTNAQAAKSKRKYLIEVWDEGTLRQCISSEDVHGLVLGDDLFGALEWSHDETRLVYVADVETKKSKSFFDALSDRELGKKEDLESYNGRANAFREDWGEGYVGINTPSLFVVDLRTGRIRQVSGQPDEVSAGQPVWSPDDKYLVYTGWSTAQSRLGIKYCTNRYSTLYAVAVDQTLTMSSVVSLDSLRLISGPDNVASSPAFTPDGAHLVFLTPASMSAHQSATSLKRLAWAAGEPESQLPHVVVPVVARCNPTDDSFPGLYVRRLCRQPWLDAATLVLATGWKSVVHVLTVDVLSGLVSAPLTLNANVEPALADASWSLLGAADGLIVASVSSFSTPSRLAAYSSSSKRWNVLPLPAATQANVTPLKFSRLVVDVPLVYGEFDHVQNYAIPATPSSSAAAAAAEAPAAAPAESVPPVTLDDQAQRNRLACSRDASTTTDEDDEAAAAAASNANAASAAAVAAEAVPAVATDAREPAASAAVAAPPLDNGDSAARTQFHSVLVSSPFTPVAEASAPLILCVHGGPHSMFDTSYTLSMVFMASIGYSLLLVNFRGSLGYGEDALESLPGKIGTLDVRDCKAALDQCLATHKQFDPRRVCVMGGSHGGFLSAHLISQYPNAFRASMMRNPVINIPGMVGTTDIPDWCHTEGIGAHDQLAAEEPLVDGEALKAMWEVSPLRRVREVKAAVLLAIGSVDRRVPHSSALEFMRHLRARGVPVHVLMYDGENHAISGVANEADCFINGALWFDQYSRAL